VKPRIMQNHQLADQIETETSRKTYFKFACVGLQLAPLPQRMTQLYVYIYTYISSAFMDVVYIVFAFDYSKNCNSFVDTQTERETAKWGLKVVSWSPFSVHQQVPTKSADP